MSLIQDVKKEAKQKKGQKKRDGNTILDIFLQVVSAGTILFLAGYEISRHIDATYPTNVMLTMIGITFLMYLLLSPIYRKK